MNYLAYLFLNHLPYVEVENRLINGKEEPCLIIPTKTNQIKKGKSGNWMMMCRLAELPPNERMQTHDIQLSYLTPEDLQKSRDFGYHRRTSHLGRVYEHDISPEKKIDRTNNATDTRLDGIIVLSDIPNELIFRNSQNQRRYIDGLTIRGLSDDGVIFTGSVCVDDIPREDIQTDPDTGKKFINARFVKLPMLDTYMNTHQLIIAREDGSAIEIGRFKEWRREGYQVTSKPQNPIPDNPPNQRNVPDSIQGIRF